jgi:hypothetical protein
MQKVDMVGCRCALAASALLLSACETASLAPEARTAPAPVAHEAAQVSLSDHEALLRAMRPGQAVDPEHRATIRILSETLARMTRDMDAGTRPATLSVSAERALREFAATAGGEAEMQRILAHLVEERSAPDARQ